MKILVYDIAAEDGGALAILKGLYRDVIESCDKDIEWLFVVSQPFFTSVGPVRVIVACDAKKSYMHRLAYEKTELPKLVERENPDVILSLQNMPAPGAQRRQFVYLHQSLQYCPKRFSLLKPNERSLAFRQKVICNINRRGLKKADHIFVQTKWIKDATIKWLNCKEDAISVVPVSISVDEAMTGEYVGYKSRQFFYPARPEEYKNHEIIINACNILSDRGVKDYRVVFTFGEADSGYTKSLARMAEGAPIDFVGFVDPGAIWDYYKSSVLLFPSYLETCGLPLLEMRAIGGVILASDMPFSHEALDDYPNVHFFAYNNPEQLADLIEGSLSDLNCQKVKTVNQIDGSTLMQSVLEQL